MVSEKFASAIFEGLIRDIAIAIEGLLPSNLADVLRAPNLRFSEVHPFGKTGLSLLAEEGCDLPESMLACKCFQTPILGYSTRRLGFAPDCKMKRLAPGATDRLRMFGVDQSGAGLQDCLDANQVALLGRTADPNRI